MTEDSDFVGIIETWIEEKDKKFLENKLSKKFRWDIISANRENKKGRAKGGFIIGIKKDWCSSEEYKIKKVREDVIKTEILGKDKKLIIWSVYTPGDDNDFWKFWKVEDLLDEENMIMGGDFNVRIGKVG